MRVSWEPRREFTGEIHQCSKVNFILSFMLRDFFFDPKPEQQNVVLIDAATLRKAQQMIESCAKQLEET